MPAGAKGDGVGELAVPLGAMKRLLGRLNLALERGLQVGELLVASMEGRRLGHHNLARLTEVVDLACETLLVGRQRLEVPAVLLLEVVEPPAERARERRLVTRGRFCYKGGSAETASSASRNRTATNANLTYFDELASSSTSAMVMSRSARSFEMSVSRPARRAPRPPPRPPPRPARRRVLALEVGVDHREPRVLAVHLGAQPLDLGLDLLARLDLLLVVLGGDGQALDVAGTRALREGER
jgi:hypothetical protein